MAALLDSDGQLNSIIDAYKLIASLGLLNRLLTFVIISSASNRARLPAEFKHINKRRKRKQL